MDLSVSSVDLRVINKSPNGIPRTKINIRYSIFLWPGTRGLVPLAFNGAGDTFTPTLINLFCFWLVEIPLVYYLALEYGLEETGVFLAIITSESLVGIVGIILFKMGRWKTREV